MDKEEDEEKCEICGRPTPTNELLLYDGICSRCEGMTDEM